MQEISIKLNDLHLYVDMSHFYSSTSISAWLISILKTVIGAIDDGPSSTAATCWNHLLELTIMVNFSGFLRLLLDYLMSITL